MAITPCDNCIEIECEVNGYVCPLYEKYQDTLERPQECYTTGKSEAEYAGDIIRGIDNE